MIAVLDASAAVELVLVRRNNAILLTLDKKLKVAARKSGVNIEHA
jgi:rRNA-processing protein FCF1